MTDYYEELELDRNLETAELVRQLVRLESVWRRREITNPEKARIKLVAITEAKNVFKDDASRAGYDRDLADSKKAPAEPAPDTDRKDQYYKWMQQAETFLSKKEFELARTAFEKARGYLDADDNDQLFYFLTIGAVVLDEAGAEDSVQKMILLFPEEPQGYGQRGISIEEKADRMYDERSYSDWNSLVQIYREAYRYYDMAKQKAEMKGNTSYAVYLTVCMARIGYKTHDESIPYEEMAHEAISMGDTSGDAEMLLEAIEQERIEEKARSWRNKGLCQYCGGSFTGIFSKKCSSCGRPKDY